MIVENGKFFAPDPKCTEVNGDVGEEEKCCRRDIVRIPAALAFGSGQLLEDKNSTDDNPTSTLL